MLISYVCVYITYSYTLRVYVSIYNKYIHHTLI